MCCVCVLCVLLLLLLNLNSCPEYEIMIHTPNFTKIAKYPYLSLFRIKI